MRTESSAGTRRMGPGGGDQAPAPGDPHKTCLAPGSRPPPRAAGTGAGSRAEAGTRSRGTSSPGPRGGPEDEVIEVITCVTGRGHLLMISVTEGSPHGRGAL